MVINVLCNLMLVEKCHNCELLLIWPLHRLLAYLLCVYSWLLLVQQQQQKWQAACVELTGWQHDQTLSTFVTLSHIWALSTARVDDTSQITRSLLHDLMWHYLTWHLQQPSCSNDCAGRLLLNSFSDISTRVMHVFCHHIAAIGKIMYGMTNQDTELLLTVQYFRHTNICDN